MIAVKLKIDTDKLQSALSDKIESILHADEALEHLSMEQMKVIVGCVDHGVSCALNECNISELDMVAR